jgi:hypothetical protein
MKIFHHQSEVIELYELVQLLLNIAGVQYVIVVQEIVATIEVQ